MTDNKNKSVQNEWNFGNAQIIGGNQNWGATISGGTFVANTKTEGESEDEGEQEETVKEILQSPELEIKDSEVVVTGLEYAILRITEVKKSWKKWVLIKDGNQVKKLELLGTEEVMKEVEEENRIKSKFSFIMSSESKEIENFFPVFLVRIGEGDIRHRVGLVLIRSPDKEKLKKATQNDFTNFIIQCEKDETLKLESISEKKERKVRQELATTELTKDFEKEKYRKMEAYLEKEITRKTSELLKIKNDFLNARQETITKLRECCDKLEGSVNIGKHAKISEAGSIISAGGTAVNNLTFGVVKAVGELITAGNNSSKRKSLVKRIGEFQDCLNNDERRLLLFNESYNSLISIIWENKELSISSVIGDILKLENRLKNKEVKLFEADYETYEIINIWKGKKVLMPEEMKKTIELLSDNLKKLRTELEEEQKQFEDLKVQMQEEKFQDKIEVPLKKN